MKPSEKELFYNSFAPRWEKYINNAETKKRLKVVFLDLLKGVSLKDKNFLEIGCGLGFFSLEALKRGACITAVDVGKNLVDITKKRVKKGKFIVASASKLPFKDNSFDIVLCTEVIEHVENQKEAFDEMFRVLKKDGYLVLTTPNKAFKPLFDILSLIKIRAYQGNEKWFFFDEIKNIFNKRKADIVKEVHFNFIYPNHILDHFEKIKSLKLLMINQAYLIKKNQ